MADHPITGDVPRHPIGFSWFGDKKGFYTLCFCSLNLTLTQVATTITTITTITTMRPQFGPFLSSCLLLVAMMIALAQGAFNTACYHSFPRCLLFSNLPTSINQLKNLAGTTVCSCGAGSCSPTQCRDYPINQCVQAYNLCDGTPNGYVTVTQSGSNYVGNFYSDSQCQTTAVASFSAPCGVCNTGLLVQVQCSGGSSAATLNSWHDAVSGLSL
jgi:hypothetical protein